MEQERETLKRHVRDGLLGMHFPSCGSVLAPDHRLSVRISGDVLLQHDFERRTSRYFILDLIYLAGSRFSLNFVFKDYRPFT